MVIGVEKSQTLHLDSNNLKSDQQKLAHIVNDKSSYAVEILVD
jgi:hypothetical protein